MGSRPRRRSCRRRAARLGAPADHARPNSAIGAPDTSRPPGTCAGRLLQTSRAMRTRARRARAMTSTATATDYRATLNLPDTPFPMRGDLPKREPGWVKAVGRARHLQDAARRAPRRAAVRAARRPAVCQRPAAHRPRRQQDPEGHDRQGAPARRLRRAIRAGLGLPRPADREPDREDVRPQPAAATRCRPKSRAYATEQIAQQMADFKRLGVLGDWDQPYRTMDFGNEAGEIRALQAHDRARLRLPRPEAGVLVLRLRLVAGRVRDRVRRQASRRRVDVGFLCAEPDKLAAAFGLPALEQGRVRGDLDDDAVDDPGQPGAQPEPRARLRAGRHRARPAGARRRAGRAVPGALRRSKARSSRRRKGAALDGIAFHHPLAHAHPGYERLSPVYLADYATAEDGTGIVHSSPAYGVDDFNSCIAHGLELRRHPEPGAGQRHATTADAAAVRRPGHLEGGAARSSMRCATPAACSRPRRCCTAIRTAGATRRR